MRVDFATQDQSAGTGDNDYTGTSGTLVIPAGSRTGTITVKVMGDTKVENNETFLVNLSNPQNATILDGQGVGTIVNDDAPPSAISINDVSKPEGNSGTRTMTFTVKLSSASTRTVTVSYSTHGVTATTSDHDYLGASGGVSIAPGLTTATINITIYGDTKRESNETFEVNLTGSVNATIADGKGIGTITNDDGYAVSSTPADAGTGVADEVSVDFGLGFAAPNPTPGAFRIDFTLPRESPVRLSMLDVQGREIALVTDGIYGPGRHQVSWNGSLESGRVSPGLYFVRAVLADRRFVKRLVITP